MNKSILYPILFIAAFLVMCACGETPHYEDMDNFENLATSNEVAGYFYDDKPPNTSFQPTQRPSKGIYLSSTITLTTKVNILGIQAVIVMWRPREPSVVPISHPPAPSPEN